MSKKRTKSSNDGTPELHILRGAVFSPQRTFRYELGRVWHIWLPILVAILINPSTADENKDDATTTFMVNWARKHGYGQYWAYNLFALVGTDPKCLFARVNPSGPDNDDHIRHGLRRGGDLLVAWGALAFIPKASPLKHRAEEVLELIGDRRLLCFGKTKDGNPRFPRALGLNVKVVKYR